MELLTQVSLGCEESWEDLYISKVSSQRYSNGSLGRYGIAGALPLLSAPMSGPGPGMDVPGLAGEAVPGTAAAGVSGAIRAPLFPPPEQEAKATIKASARKAFLSIIRDSPD
jgi:hypothetical protein